MATASRSVQSASLQGMALGVGAYTFFAIHDAVVKGIIFDLPVVQILFVRSVVVAVICLALGRGAIVRDLLASPRKGMILMRAILSLAAWLMYYSAGTSLKLAEMTTLYYFAPVLTMVLAIIFLKERVTLARVGASALGFFGVVVACNPAGLTIGLPAILVLAAAFCWSVATILMRNIAKTERSVVQILALNLFQVLTMGTASIPLWQPMGLRELGFVLSAGIIGGMAQYCLIEAARQVPASVLGTVEYGALVWAFVFGFVFWHEQPALTVYVGAMLVIVAGLLLAWSEHRGRREVMDAP